MEPKPKIIVIVGPTASGKSDLAVELAKQFNGEVISADSRQVHRGMDIGTGKITQGEMRGIPHHLLGIASPKIFYSAATYRRDAERALRKILARGKLPIVCGGTGFYISALVDGLLLPDVPPDQKLRKQLEERTTTQLLALLGKLDPKRAAAIDAKNPRRLIRAIEIARTLGKVPPLFKKQSAYETLKIGILIPGSALRGKIRDRLTARMKKGMVAEVKRLHAEGVSWKRMEAFGLEYRYLARYLQKNITKKEMLVMLENEIAHYAKRQMTWFKKDKDIRWVPKKNSAKAKVLVKKFLEQTPRLNRRLRG